MKILKYSITGNDFAEYDLAFVLIDELIESKFSQEKINIQFHTNEDYEFFFIGILEDQEVIKNIIEEVKSDLDFECIIEDHTNNIFNNSSEYADLPNFCADRNTLLEYFYNNQNKDGVLDKILEFGIESLNIHDRNILENKKSLI